MLYIPQPLPLKENNILLDEIYSLFIRFNLDNSLVNYSHML